MGPAADSAEPTVVRVTREPRARPLPRRERDERAGERQQAGREDPPCLTFDQPSSAEHAGDDRDSGQDWLAPIPTRSASREAAPGGREDRDGRLIQP